VQKKAPAEVGEEEVYQRDNLRKAQRHREKRGEELPQLGKEFLMEEQEYEDRTLSG